MFLFIATVLGVIALGVAVQKTVQVVSAVSSVVSNFSTYYNSEEWIASKSRLIPDKSHIIGLQSPRLVVNPSTLTTTKFDTTTYPDRAIITLTNSTGADIVCTGISIQGKVVYQFDGAYQWDWKDYTSIEKSGESSIEVSNRFIISADQTESLGDYIAKELQPHSMYTLHIPGCILAYDVGDVWHLAISYTIPNQVSEAELIDTDVEITAVSFSRQVGGIGETLLEVRVPSGAWTKTTSRRARLISDGRAQRLYNRGNVLTVASSTWAGQADYFCDGTDDDVEIQDAIDAMSARGGGEVYLTEGPYTIGTTLVMKDNVWLYGSGEGTILYPESSSITTMINWTSAVNAKASSFVINGNSASITFSTNLMKIVDGTATGSIFDVTITNYSYLAEVATRTMYVFYDFIKIERCNVVSNTMENISVVSNLIAFASCYNLVSCSGSLNNSTSASNYIIGYTGCSRLSSCTFDSNTSSGASSRIISFQYCNYMTNCGSSSNNMTGNATGIQSFYNCQYLSSCHSLSNTLGAGTGLPAIISFNTCSNLTTCYAQYNVSTSSTETSFENCRSVQQCKALDTTKYTTSYADSGTANACADTAAGGYNS